VEVRGKVDGFGVARPDERRRGGRREERRRAAALLCLLASRGARRMKRKRKGGSLTSWPHRLSSERLHRHTATRGGVNAEIGGELSTNRGGTVTQLRDF